MGTNFDVRYNICKKCGHYDELHLGKASYGWEFCFQGYPSLWIKSVKKWKEFIDHYNGKIFDEYGKERIWDEIMKWCKITVDFKRKKHESIQHIEYYRDLEGYCFTDEDFS